MMIEYAQITKRAEVVLAQRAQLVLEVSVLAFKGRVVLKSEWFAFLDAQELVTSNHRPTVETLVVVTIHTGVTDGDKREQAFGTTKDSPKLVDGVV